MVSLGSATNCKSITWRKHNADQVLLLFSFVCYQGFRTLEKEARERERERKQWREEEINKLNKAVEAMTEVNRNLAQSGRRLTAYLAGEHTHTHTNRRAQTQWQTPEEMNCFTSRCTLSQRMCPDEVEDMFFFLFPTCRTSCSDFTDSRELLHVLLWQQEWQHICFLTHHLFG